MKLFRFAMLLAVVALVAGCPRVSQVADCSQDDVKATLIRALEQYADNEPWRTEIVHGVKIRNIVTTERDDDLGHYSCSAELWHEGFGNGAVTRDVEYQVQRIEDGADGNDFQILYDKIQFSAYSGTIGIGSRQRGDAGNQLSLDP